MNPTRTTATNWLSAIGYRLILGVSVSVFAVTAFAADCKVNDSDISDEYVGGCVNGLAHGKGKAKGKDTYEGEFKQGNKHGKGTYIWAANGNKYEGDWLNDKMHGKGTFIWAVNGNKYEGDWLNDRKHGKGIMIWPSGNKYEGDWLNDKNTGKATFIWANGDKYVGDFLDGKHTGNGLNIWSDGSRYEGEYRDGKRHGFGELRFVKGNEGIQDYERQAETRGRWVGDIYVVKGLFVANEKGSDFILSCTSPQNCKQVQANREAQERREAAERDEQYRRDAPARQARQMCEAQKQTCVASCPFDRVLTRLPDTMCNSRCLSTICY